MESVSDLQLPFLPSNMRVEPHMRNAHVTGDLYNLCERIKEEISPNLYICPLYDEGPWRFLIVEECRDGIERPVFKAQTLDERVFNELRRMMAAPLEERIRRIERDEEKFYADEQEREQERLWHEVGDPMRHHLEKAGFADRGVSYPKRGVTGGRGSKKMLVKKAK